VVTESALDRDDVKDEIELLDTSLGGGGAAEAVAMAFFATQDDPAENLNAISESSLLGTLVLINYRAPGHADFTHSYIYEALLRPPTLRIDGGQIPLLNNFICADGSFVRRVRGRDFPLQGIFYAQQNGQTHVCAHACLRMALNSIGVCNPPITSGTINSTLSISPPLTGLSLGQISTVIDGIPGVKASIVDCNNLAHSKFLTILAAIVESGHVALLVFTTGKENVEHVVTVFGHTRNSDEWHPEPSRRIQARNQRLIILAAFGSTIFSYTTIILVLTSHSAAAHLRWMKRCGHIGLSPYTQFGRPFVLTMQKERPL
jgi:hypothetical protein